MKPYKRMYNTLFNKITAIMAEFEQVQQETEEMYLEDPDEFEGISMEENLEIRDD